MSLRKHPWHAAVVHFPLALLSLDTLLKLWAWLQPQQRLNGLPLRPLADVLIWTGLILSLPALALGVRDWLRCRSADPRAVGVFAAHVTSCAIALSAYLMTALLLPGSAGRALCGAFAGLLLLGGGWYGARLVHEFGLTQPQSLAHKRARPHPGSAAAPIDQAEKQASDYARKQQESL